MLLLLHLIPQLSLAINIVFSPFVRSMDDYLYSSAQLVVSIAKVYLGCTDDMSIICLKEPFADVTPS